jgi:probable HAF family extracellular repeat protein
MRHGACVLSAFALTLMAHPSGALAFTFTTINVPGAPATQANAINATGQIVGFYDTEVCCTFHGFLWDKGTFTTIGVPGATGTAAAGINNAGQIVGGYSGGGFVTQKGHDED